MGQRRFELRDIEWTPRRFLLLVLMVTAASIHLGVATVTERLVFAVLGLGLLVTFIGFFTALWRPNYCLVGAGYVGAIAAVWYFMGRPLLEFTIFETVLQGGIFVVLMVLLLIERLSTIPEA